VSVGRRGAVAQSRSAHAALSHFAPLRLPPATLRLPPPYHHPCHCVPLTAHGQCWAVRKDTLHHSGPCASHNTPHRARVVPLQAASAGCCTRTHSTTHPPRSRPRCDWDLRALQARRRRWCRTALSSSDCRACNAAAAATLCCWPPCAAGIGLRLVRSMGTPCRRLTWQCVTTPSRSGTAG